MFPVLFLCQLLVLVYVLINLVADADFSTREDRPWMVFSILMVLFSAAPLLFFLIMLVGK